MPPEEQRNITKDAELDSYVWRAQTILLGQNFRAMAADFVSEEFTQATGNAVRQIHNYGKPLSAGVAYHAAIIKTGDADDVNDCYVAGFYSYESGQSKLSRATLKSFVEESAGKTVMTFLDMQPYQKLFITPENVQPKESAMTEETKLSVVIDAMNDRFTSAAKERLSNLPVIPEATLEWITMEHYQFSFANKGLLASAIEATKQLSEPGVSAELLRNYNEEDGHAPMYKEGMRRSGTDFDTRAEYAPTTEFLAKLSDLSSSSPSRVLGALYATETAAIFEHEVFDSICHELCVRRGAQWEGSLIKQFHDIHLVDGVEQGHKDGLAEFVDSNAVADPAKGQKIDRAQVLEGATVAIDLMRTWWDTLLTQVDRPDPAIISRRIPVSGKGLGGSA